MSNTIALPHHCHCKNYNCAVAPVVAYTFQEVESLFGYRNMPAGIAPQTWCRECRLKQLAESRASK